MRPLPINIYDRPHREPAALEAQGVTRPKVLLVMSSQVRGPLLEGLEALGIEILCVRNCRHAGLVLETHPDIRAVLTELTLADGDWRAVVAAVAEHCVNTEVIVLASSVDARLRRELRESAAYDLLVEPCSQGEVRRVVGGAVLTSYRRYIGLSDLAFCSRNGVAEAKYAVS